MDHQSIEIVYNGKDFKRIERATLSDEDKVATLGIAADIDAVLQTLRGEIDSEGGTVTVNVKGPGMFEIDIKNLSDELAQRVHKALTPS